LPEPEDEERFYICVVKEYHRETKEYIGHTFYTNLKQALDEASDTNKKSSFIDAKVVDIYFSDSGHIMEGCL